MTIPGDGWQTGLPGTELVNDELPEPFEAVYHEGGDGSELIVPFDLSHVELTEEGEEADVATGDDASGDRQVRATLRRRSAYGVVLLDSFEDAPDPVEAIGPEGFFFGHADHVSEFGQAYQDGGSPIQGRIRTREIAPLGPAGECLFRRAVVVLEVDTAAEVTVRPIISNR